MVVCSGSLSEKECTISQYNYGEITIYMGAINPVDYSIFIYNYFPFFPRSYSLSLIFICVSPEQKANIHMPFFVVPFGSHRGHCPITFFLSSHH